MFVINSLSPGGAERVASSLVNYWAQGGDEVSMVTVGTAQEDFYVLDNRVQRMALGLNRESASLPEFLGNNLLRIGRLRQLIRRVAPDVVISFMDATNVLVLLSALGLSVRVVVSERVDPRRHLTSRVIRLLRPVLYPYAKALVVQTEEVRYWAQGFAKPASVHVIPNPVGLNSRAVTCRVTKDRHAILGMGRLEEQKGFDLLLRAFSLCYTKHPRWDLRIVGEGSNRSQLIVLTERLGIGDRVRLDPVVKEPVACLFDADLFVVSSRYEGFPNALLEAMAAGLPVISFSCPSGPSDIIRDGYDGLLVPPGDVDALALAMDRLMGDERERQELSARAIEVNERFAFDRVMPMWREVLRAATG